LDDFAALGRVVSSFCLELQVLDHVLGGLDHDGAEIVEALAARAAADLLEIAYAEDRCFLSIEFAQPNENHDSDKNVDPDSERVGPADHFEEPFLRELLHEQPVLWQKARVMQPDAIT